MMIKPNHASRSRVARTTKKGRSHIPKVASQTQSQPAKELPVVFEADQDIVPPAGAGSNASGPPRSANELDGAAVVEPEPLFSGGQGAEEAGPSRVQIQAR